MATGGQKRVQNRTDILIELKDISPVLADINHQHVYHVPVGYFDALAGLIMLQVRERKTNGAFSAPPGFFESFPEQLMARIRNGEKSEFSSELADMSPFLAKISREMPYSVPPGYFTQLAENIQPGLVGSLQDEDETELPGILLGLKHKQVYQAPVGYFDALHETVLAGLSAQEPARIIPFARKSNWLKYAAAAVLIGVVATSSVLFFNRHTASTGDNAPSLAMVSDQEMINYLEVQPMPLVAPDAGSVATADINESDGVDLLGDIPDDELQQYIDDHTSPNGTILN